MRNIIGIIAAGMIMFGFVGIVIFGGMLDAPSAPIVPAIYVGIAAMVLFAGGGYLAQIFERGRKNV